MVNLWSCFFLLLSLISLNFSDASTSEKICIRNILKVSDSSESSGSIENSLPSVLGKRSAHSFPIEPKTTPANLISCVKGIRNRPSRKVKFRRSVLLEHVIDISNPLAEINYINALFTNKKSLVKAMNSQGFVLSNSNMVFSDLNEIFKLDKVPDYFIKYLFRHQPHVFYQDYDNGENVYSGASQANIDYICDNYSFLHSAMLKIFKEVIRNPELKLKQSFYYKLKISSRWEIIRLAENSPRGDLVESAYLIPNSLAGINEAGETFLTEAVKDRNLPRINWLLKRSDALKLLSLKNDFEENPIDLAVKLYESKDDPGFEIFRKLFLVIRYSALLNECLKLDVALPLFFGYCESPQINIQFTDALMTELKRISEHLKKSKNSNAFINTIDRIDNYLDLLLTLKLEFELISEDSDSLKYSLDNADDELKTESDTETSETES